MQPQYAFMQRPAFARPPGPRMQLPSETLQCFGAFFARAATPEALRFRDR